MDCAQGRVRTLLSALLIAASCGPKDNTTTTTEGGTTTTEGTTVGASATMGTTSPTSDATESTTVTTLTTGPETTGTTAGPSTTTTAPTTDSGSTSTGPDPTTTTDPVDQCPGLKNAGEECQLDMECAAIASITDDGPLEQWDIQYNCEGDGKCFVVPLIGGLCGECVSAADCPDGGCTIPNPLLGWPSRCNDGSLGDGCDADGPNTCQDGLTCGTVLDAAGILTVSTCGECATSIECQNPTPFCAPDLNVPAFTGVMSCVAPGSIPMDGACAIGEDGACATGICGTAVVMGVIEVGICSECESDADCGPNQACVDPVVDIDTIPDDPYNPPPDYQSLYGGYCQ